jgi:ligand-binding sensor domain-containing protein
MPRRRSCFILFYLIIFFQVRAQDFIFKHYDLQQGLASPTIHCIFQDRAGFIWFGTESGLCRYDGTSFKTFTVKDGLAGNEVFGMFEDSRGRLWLQQYQNTIGYIFNGKVHNQENDSLLKNFKLTSRVHGIAEDKSGNLAICDNESVFMLYKDRQSIRRVTADDRNASHFIAMYTDRLNDIVVCTQHDLYKVVNNHLQHIQHLSSENERFSPTDILLHANYIVYRLKYLTTIALKDTVIHATIPNIFHLKYSPISDSVFSINTIDGALIYNINTFRYFKILPGVKVSNLYMDRERNLWIGTVSKGVYKLNSQEIVNNKIGEGENDIYYITRDSNQIIVGNNNGGVYEFSKNKFRVLNKQNNRDLSMRKIFYVENLPGNGFIMAHAMGLIHYVGEKQKGYRNLTMLKQASPSDKDRLLVAVDSGLYSIRKTDFTTADSIWNRRTLSALKINDTIWVGTSAGLFLLKKNGNRYVVSDSLLPSSIIAFIKKSENNLIWVATYEDGLYCIRNGKILYHFTDASGLPGNNGRSLFVHGNDVWEGTDRGAVKIHFTASGYIMKRYSTSDGLPSDIINSLFVDGNMVYLGTPEGLCSFDESRIETTSICNLVLTGVSIGDKTVELTDGYVLKRNQPINITFSGISFRSEQQISYRYRIIGLNDNWRSTKVNALEFTSLPYGKYALEIVAINKFNKESTPVCIHLDIRKPFYLATWFIILISVVIISLVLLVYNRRMNVIKEKQLQKLQQKIKLMELEQMALRAQMNPHFIFNCINVMQQLVAENDQHHARKFLLSFSNLVRQTLDNATELFIPLHEELKFLTNYFELERIRLEDRFWYIIDTSHISNINTLLVPNMVIQPFVENAIKHGIRYKKNGEGLIEVVFTETASVLICTITDNGIGREKAAQVRKELGISYTSKGTSITFKRIESLNALAQNKISISIEDLKDDKQNAAGTKVVIAFQKNELS